MKNTGSMLTANSRELYKDWSLVVTLGKKEGALLCQS